MEDTKERLVSLLEPAQAGPAQSDQNDTSLPTELENSPADELSKVVEELPKTEEQAKAEEPPRVEEPSETVEELPKTKELLGVEELPKADSTEDTSTSTPTKKSKKDKKKKKKAAGREEEAPLDDNKTLADSVSGATELSEAITTVSAEAGEDKGTESHNVSGDAVTAQDKTIPQDDNTSKIEDAAPDETVAKDESKASDGDATRSEVVPQNTGAPNDDGAPQEEGDSKEEAALQSKPVSDSLPSDDSAPTKSEENEKEKSAGSWEDELLQEFAEKPAEAPAVDLAESIEKEISVQELASVESVTDTASVKKSKKDKKKKKQSGPLAEELPEEKPTEDPLPTAVADLGQTTEDQIQAPTPEPNDNDLAVPATPAKRSKKDKKKKKGITQDDELVEEQLTHDSAIAATSDATSSVVNEPPESEPAAAEPPALELSAPELPASEPPASELPASEPSNDDGLIQPISKKKSKKDKKKKKQMGSMEDDVPPEALSEGDAPKVDSPQEELVEDDPSREDISKEELSAETSPKEEIPEEELPKEELLKELPREELLREELSREELAPENVSEIAPDTLGSGEPGQVTLSQVEAEATSEPATVIDSEKTPNDETIKVDIPPNDDSPGSTPTKKSKKDKIKKQTSILEDEATPQEESKQLEESQPLSVAEIAPEVGLPPEGEASEAVVPDDVKLEDLADPAPTKKSKKDKKKKKVPPEADLAQEPVEAPADPILSGAPDSSQQTEAGVSLPDVSIEMEATELSPKQSKKGGKKEQPTSWEDEVPPQLQPSLAPDLSRDASAEPSQSEGVLELASSKKSKKNKKKKRASEVEPQPEVETGVNPDSAAGLAEVAELAEINSSSPPVEQLPIHVIEDQDSSSQEPRALSQDDAAKPPDNLDAGAKSTESPSTEDTAPSAKLDDAGESNVESKIGEISTNAVPEDATPGLSSHDQQATPRAVEDEPLHELTLETGRETGTGSLTPLQEPETAQPETAQPETAQPETGRPEEAAPKVDDGTNTAMSKKSKKDKKKKKRASQVSWELGPEAEIEDPREKQQSEQAFDTPMIGEPTEMGNSDKAVGDPFFEFASGEKSEDIEKRQSRIEGEPEPDSAKTVEELKPITLTEQEQRHDMLLDHQSLAEDTETSLKDSTNLDDTFLETTSSKKSKKKKKKASQLDWDVEPATTVTSESATDLLFIEQNLTDKSAEPVDALPIETTEITSGKEADAEKGSPEIVSIKQSKKDKRKVKKQSDAETPEPDTTIRQPAENESTINDGIISQVEPAATANLIQVDDSSVIPENQTIPDENDIAGEPSRNLPAEEIKLPLDQAKDAKESSQGQSSVHGTNILDTVVDTEPSHANLSGSGNYPVLPSKLEEASDEVSLKEQAEVQQVEVPAEVEKDTTTDTSQDLSQELPESPTKKSKKDKKKAKNAQVLNVPDADSNEKSSTILQSWDWSNIDNVTQPEFPVSKAAIVSDEFSKVELPATVEPSDATQTTSRLEQKEEPSNDNVDSSKLEFGEPELRTQLEPGPEPEFPIARKRSKRDKKKKKETSQSESETASAPGTPQTQNFEGAGDSQNAAPPDPTIREAEAMEPQNKEGTTSEKKSRKDKKRAKALSLEETPQSSLDIADASQEPAALEQPTSDEIPQVENQNAEARSPLAADQPILLQEQTSVAHDMLSEKPAIIPDITEEGQLPSSDSRPRTPSTSRQVLTTVDMSPAQLSSHIEHDRPFDQSTQPDKKPRTHLGENDAMVPEPLSAMTTELSALLPSESNSRVTDAMATDIPFVSEEYIQQREKAEISDNAPRDIIITHVESDPVNLDDLQATSNQKEYHGHDLSLGHNKTVPKESPTGKPDRKKQSQVNEDQIAETAAVIDPGAGEVAEKAENIGGSKKAKGKKKLKNVDARTSKDDDIFDDPTLWESPERKPLEEGSRLDADSSDFWTGPTIKAKEQSDEAAREMTGAVASQEVPEPTQHHDLGADDTNIESPVKGRGVVPELPIPRPSDAEEARSQIKGISTTGRQDSWDDLDTSEPLEDHDVSLHVGARDVLEESFLPSLPPPRTPSALDYSRSLPPVEEETREDLEKESLSVLKDKTRTGLEANRDSGLATGSPNPQRRSLGDAGQRDSGVHMTLGPSEETTGSQEGSTRTVPSPPDQGSSSQTPQTRERRSRRSLFDNETPKLSTPTQSRGWDRGTTPEKPAEDEPVKRATTPLTRTPQQQTPRSVSDNVSSDTRRGTTPQPENVARRSASNMSISRLRTPELFKYRPDSPGSHSIRSVHSIRSLRSSGAMTPPLRRVDRRMSGDLRALSHSGSTTPSLPISTSDKDKDGPARAKDTDVSDVFDRHAAGLHHNITPIANEGRVRSKDMTDVYDGYGEGRIGSPRSPTRPPSMRRRQSMQVLELEARVEHLLAENRVLADARAHAEQNLSQRNTSAITDRDAEIESLKASLQWLQNEVTRLTEVNEGLQSANSLLALQHNEKYTRLESQHTTTARELEEHRGARDQYTQTLQAKDAEIQELRNQLEATKDQIREMKKQILAAKPPDADFLRLRDEDHFDHRCQQLCSHVQQWVLRFSKFSDMRACRLTSEINDEKIIDRLDNTILDGSDVDDYLSDRVARRDIFISMTMNMIWEFVFTRYLFGMDREQRQKLKSLEKILTDVGPPHAVRQWRAVTLTLLSRRPAFGDQRNQDTEAVVQAILQTLSMILPPPTNLEAQIQSQLRRVMREAVDLSLEMRTQRAEYMMLPPLQPEYDANGELTQTVSFNAALMNERSGDSSTTNEEYEAKGAIVRCVLFPLVVKKGDDNGVGDDEIVISPAQVLVAKVRRSTIRMVTPSSENGGVPLSRGATPSALGQSTVSVNMKDAPLTPPGYV
ncbi:hypothetical protein F4782DRAFT_483598 [Xylaria castorea]|nr:hypothetical protein F4782DRAFT_483598 [Xylaria castorea]